MHPVRTTRLRRPIRFLFLTAVLSLLVSLAIAAQSEAPFRETVTVVRYLVDVRVTDYAGRAITDLDAGDFSVRIDGKPAVVESATWVSSNEATLVPNLDESSEDYGQVIEEPNGRLLVLFIQTDFGRAAPRIIGQLAFNPMAEQILELLEPNDRVAVFQHDSHLKMRLDFSLDREAIRKAVRDSIRIEKVAMPEMAIGPSLVRLMNHEEMKRSVSTESSLLLIADALRELEGTKLMILAGWGLGETQGGRMAARRDALNVLNRDKVPIISVSTGVVGGSLNPGMQSIAVQTGGAYAGSSQASPQQTIVRVAGALAGYYELVIRSDVALEPGRHPIVVTTSRPRTTVNAPPIVIVDPTRENLEVVLEPLQAQASPERTAAHELYAAAMQHLRDGESEDVERLLTEALAADAGYAPAWYERGMLAAGRGDFDAALSDLRKYLELEPRGMHAPDVRAMIRSFDDAQ